MKEVIFIRKHDIIKAYRKHPQAQLQKDKILMEKNNTARKTNIFLGGGGYPKSKSRLPSCGFPTDPTEKFCSVCVCAYM